MNAAAALNAAARPPATEVPAADGVREVLDFVVMVLILLFVFRSFGAEAFVIPTGSMAPTLMGRHKDLRCANCGFAYQVNASHEVDVERLPGSAADAQPNPERDAVTACTCPVCRFTMQLNEPLPGEQPEPSYSGDRIIVSKSAYLMADPKRFDVAVFRYPAGATTNYIKRIVGLPGEAVKISHGDVSIRPAGGSSYTIARKSPAKVRALLQVVHENDPAFNPASPGNASAAAWIADQAPSGSPTWTTADGGQSFGVEGPGEHRLRYHHRPPSYLQWDALSPDEAGPPPVGPLQLIADFTSYNTNYSQQSGVNRLAGAEADLEALGLHWVGDLAVECEVEVAAPQGALLLELVEGGRRFHCRIELSTGLATLSIDGVESFQPTAQALDRGPGKHHLRFANVDDQLLLWVQDKLVEFHQPTTYEELANNAPTTADLLPVNIVAADAELRVAKLRVLRDNYYIAAHNSPPPIADYTSDPLTLVPLDVGQRDFTDGGRLAKLLSTPGLWPNLLSHRRAVEFQLGADEFLVLGDNSPRSKDSRFWTGGARRGGSAHAVHRRLLLGKAVFVYWPHSWNRTSRDGRWFPGFPNWERMGFVR